MRQQGYLPLRDYAALGDGRTVALVGLDGAIDWLCLPNLDSPSVFGAILDAERGGRFVLEPESPFQAERRYLPHTNVLETTFTTADGSVRVTDALTLPNHGLAPFRELARRIEGLSGRVRMVWRLEPRFGYGLARTRVELRGGTPVATSGADALALASWDAGEPELANGSVWGRFRARDGSRALLALVASSNEPLVFPTQDDVERRLDETTAYWRRWSGDRKYEGPWREAVLRSILVLKLLVHAPSGAIAAAATTSLPETLGGERNWDYRYAWVRDSAFTIDAFLGLGCDAETHSFFWWLLHASQRTHPRLQALYRLDGNSETDEKTIPLSGYRDSRPVRIGNGAAGQHQLDIYGDLMQAAWRYAEGGRLDSDTGRRLAQVAELVCAVWREPDSGIWEVRSARRHFTHSKMMCWVALDRAAKLADAGKVSASGVERWRSEADAIRTFIEERCYSERLASYVRSAGNEELDASVLLAVILDYCRRDDPRFATTIDALTRELGRGALLMRYRSEDGGAGDEGAFVTCSFWLVDALARSGRLEKAVELMEALLGLGNDVGLYAEEIDPDTKDFLGNMPQGLVHLALVGAARSIAEAST